MQRFRNKLSQSKLNILDTTFAKDITKFIKANIHTFHVTSCGIYILYNFYLFALRNFVCLFIVTWNPFL